MNNLHPRRGRLALVASLFVLIALVWVAPAQAQSFGGRAYSAYVNVPGPNRLVPGTGPLYIADTGPTPPGGGWNGTGGGTVQVPNVLSANVPVAATAGLSYDNFTVDKADSSTALADVTVLPGSPAQLTAAFVRAQSAVTDGVAPQGSSEIYALTFGGVPVAVTGQPNQQVEILGVATLIINEQTATASSIVVNALHLILAGGGEVILSSASSAIAF